MAAFRFIAWLLVALALALLGADAITSLEVQEPTMRTTADIFSLFGINGLGLTEVAPDGVSQAIATMMGLPLWIIIGLIGIVLTLVFRPID